MGIQLDWQIESEQENQSATENPETRRSRRIQRRNLLAFVLMVSIVIGSVTGFVLWRLDKFERDLHQDLEDTVEVELTALRLSDAENFMSVQRSGSVEWLAGQEALFREYQNLKDTRNLQLNGIQEIEIDIEDSRARVILEEELSPEDNPDISIPYRVVWFYWLYTDDDPEKNGWRHVPPDETFWGEADSIQRNNITVNYYSLDEALAGALTTQLNNWWQSSCAWLACTVPLPPLTIQITSEPLPDIEWRDSWELVVPSPLTRGRVRNDVPIPPELLTNLSEILSEKLVVHRTGGAFEDNPALNPDAEWLYYELVAWLNGRLQEDIEQGSRFLETATLNYGLESIGILTTMLHPEATVKIIEQFTGLPIGAMTADQAAQLDWRSYFDWRLRREWAALYNDEQAIYFDLYDPNDANALNAANIRRSNFNPESDPLTVQQVDFGFDNQGYLLAYVTVAPNPENLTVVNFRWLDTTWKRIN